MTGPVTASTSSPSVGVIGGHVATPTSQRRDVAVFKGCYGVQSRSGTLKGSLGSFTGRSPVRGNCTHDNQHHEKRQEERGRKRPLSWRLGWPLS
jgi:hypothetical protein